MKCSVRTEYWLPRAVLFFAQVLQPPRKQSYTGRGISSTRKFLLFSALEGSSLLECHTPPTDGVSTKQAGTFAWRVMIPVRVLDKLPRMFLKSTTKILKGVVG